MQDTDFTDRRRSSDVVGERLASLEAKFGAIAQQQAEHHGATIAAIEKLDHRLFGNGQPGSVSLLERSVDVLRDEVSGLKSFRKTVIVLFTPILGLFGGIMSLARRH